MVESKVSKNEQFEICVENDVIIEKEKRYVKMKSEGATSGEKSHV